MDRTSQSKIKGLKDAQRSILVGGVCLAAGSAVFCGLLNQSKQRAYAQNLQLTQFWQIVQNPAASLLGAPERLLAKDVRRLVDNPGNGHLYVSGDSSRLFTELDPLIQDRYHVQNGLAWTVQYDDKLESDVVKFRNGGLASLGFDATPPVPLDPTLFLELIFGASVVLVSGIGVKRLAVTAGSRRRLKNRPYAKEFEQAERLLLELKLELAAPGVQADEAKRLRKRIAKLEAAIQQFESVTSNHAHSTEDVVSRADSFMQDLQFIMEAHQEFDRA